MSRVKSVSKNINISLLLMLVDGIASFVVRTIFINNMLVELLGLNSLFTDITTLVSVADGGVGAAFASVLYKAFHDKDDDKIYAIYLELHKIYKVMTIIVFFLSIAIYYFVRVNVNVGEIVELDKIYILFIMKLVLTYANMSYYLMICSDQKIYYYKKYCFVSLFIRVVMQLVAILYCKSYVLYFAATTVYAVVPYILTRYKAIEIYKLNCRKNLGLSAEEKRIIYDRILSGMIVHVAYIIFNGTDYIMISKFCGLETTGIYSNYTMIVTMITSIISSIYVALSSGVGDMLCDDDVEKIWNNYKVVLFMNIVLIVGVAVSYLALFQPVILLWIGEKFLLSELEMILIVIVFVLGDYGFNRAVDTVRLSSGIYEKDKWYCLIAGVLNVVLSYIWAKKMGLAGILYGTVVASFLYHLPGVFFVQKYVIRKTVGQFAIYFGRILFKVIIGAAVALGVYQWCINIVGISWIKLFGCYSILLIVFGAILITLLRKEQEFLHLWNILMRNVIKREVKS